MSNLCRIATDLDIDVVRSMFDEFYNEFGGGIFDINYAGGSDTIAKGLAEAYINGDIRGVVILSFVDGVPAGMVASGEVPGSSDKVAFDLIAFVKIEYRNLGLSKHMHEVEFEWLKDSGFKEIVTVVKNGSLHQKVLEINGFTVDSVYMKKNLEA